jgi:hypothetical protein
MTQRDLALNAMFVKIENAAKAKMPRGRPWLLNADGTYAYRVAYTRLGDPYKVYRDISAYRNRPGQNMARHGVGGAA